MHPGTYPSALLSLTTIAISVHVFCFLTLLLLLFLAHTMASTGNNCNNMYTYFWGLKTRVNTLFPADL